MNEQNAPSGPSGRDLVESGGRTVRTIVVNGRAHHFAGDRIGQDELARLAFPAFGEREGRALTATFGGGPAGGERGIVAHGAKVGVAEGQRFDVRVTDRS